MRRDAAALWGVWFLALVALPAAMTVIGIQPNQVRSDEPVSRPSLEPDRMFEADYWGEFDEWITSRIATRGLALLARAKLDYELFGDSTSEEVAVGRDGFLFARDRIEHSCEAIAEITPPPLPPESADLVTYLVPFPKSHWLDHLLSGYDRPPLCQMEAREALRIRLAADPDALDPNALFADRPHRLFLKGDPHWSPEGELVVAEALIEHLWPGIWEPDAVVSTTVVEHDALYRQLGYGESRTTPGFAVDRDVSLRVTSRSAGTGVVTWQRSRVDSDDVVPGTTYIFGDDQMSYLLPLIDQYFEVLVFINWRQTGFVSIDYNTLPAPDRIVIEAAEINAAAAFTNPDLLEAFALLPDRSPPVLTGELRATATAPTVVELSWEAAQDRGEIFSYLVSRDGRGIQLLAGNETSFVDETAIPDATHSYTLTATDEAGNFATSDPAVVTMPSPDTTPPTAPVVTAVATSPTTVEITWTAATDDVGLASHLVARDGEWLELLDPAQTTYTDTGLEPDSIHSYTVVATDTAGNVTISEAVLVALPTPDTTPPTAPVVTAVATSPTTVEITWTAATDDIGLASHLVARDGQWLELLDPAQTTHTDTGLEPGSLHAYSVTATDTSGNVTISEVVLVALPEA